MVKIKKVQITDYQYTSNTISIEFDGIVNFNKVIPELIKTLEQNEEKE